MRRRVPVTDSEPSPLEELTPIPARCDRCSAEALVHVVLEASNLTLTFCGHHYQCNERALLAVASVVYDDRLKWS